MLVEYTYFPGSALDVTFNSMIGGGSTGFLSACGIVISKARSGHQTELGAYFSLCPFVLPGLLLVVGEPRAHNRRCGTTWLVGL
jgi:hypothetical protein